MSEQPAPSFAKPYVGPYPIQAGQPFFGRDTETLELTSRVTARRIVLLHSPSGAGKTSLIQAGLIPAIEAQKYLVLPTIRVSRLPATGKLPPEKVFNRFSLSTLLSLDSVLPDRLHIATLQLADMHLADFLETYRAQYAELVNKPDAKRTLLVFDQFEEILTINPTDKASKEQFFNDLMPVLDDNRYWVLFAIREDYLARLDPYLGYFPDRLSAHFQLEFLKPDAARQAIAEPAKKFGTNFQPQAADKLVDDLSLLRLQTEEGKFIEQPGPFIEPVQLQVVCARLWDAPRADPAVITLQDVEQYGSVGDALAGYYADKVRQAAKESRISERSIRQWFEHGLIAEGGLRQQVPQGREADFGLSPGCVRLLIDAWLVREENRRGNTWYELAHDRLIEPIHKNNAAWEQETLQPFQRLAEQWEKDKPDSLLLQGNELTAAETWAAAHPADLNATDRQFLEASRKKRVKEEADLKLQRKAIKYEAQRTWIVVLITISLAAFIFALLTLFFARQSNQQAGLNATQATANFALAETNQDIATANYALAEGQQYVAATNAIQATDNFVLAVTKQALAATSAYNAQLAATKAVAAQNAAGTQSSLADQNRRLAATQVAISIYAQYQTSLARSAQLASQSLGYLTTQPDLAALLSVESYRVISDTWDAKNALLINLQAGLQQQVAPYALSVPVEIANANAIALNADGRTLAWGGDANGLGKIVLWNVDLKKTTQKLDGLAGTSVNVLAFHPTNPNLLAVGYQNGSLELRDLATRGPTKTLDTEYTIPGGKQRIPRILEIAFTNDGKSMAVAGLAPGIIVYDVASGRQRGVILEGADYYYGLAYSPDGVYLAAGGSDSRLYIFDPNNVRLINVVEHPLQGGKILSLDWSKDGKWVAFSGSNPEKPEGQIIFLYDLQAKHFSPTSLIGHTAWVMSLRFDPSGRFLASAGQAGKIFLWDFKDFQPQINLPPIFSRLPDYGNSRHGLAFGKNQIAYLSNLTVSVYSLKLPNKLREEIPLNLQGATALKIGANEKGAWLATQLSDQLRIQQETRWETINSFSVGRIPSQIALEPLSTGKTVAVVNAQGQLVLYSAGKAIAKTQLPATSTALALAPSASWSSTKGGLVLASAHCQTLAGSTSDCTPTLLLWETKTGLSAATGIELTAREPLKLPAQVTSLSFNPDGVILAIGFNDGSLVLLKPASGEKFGPLAILDSPVKALAFSPDTQMLAGGSTAGILVLIDLPSLRPIGAPNQSDAGSVDSLAFSPNGKILYMLTGQKRVLAWDIDPASWIGRVCEQAGRNLTPEEWRQFLPADQTYRDTCTITTNPLP